jgi:predicted ATP-dependent serine protease
MQDKYICKDCNYASDTEGNCPYCDMPMESIDGVDEATGEVNKYTEDEIGDLSDDKQLPVEDIVAKEEIDDVI